MRFPLKFRMQPRVFFPAAILLFFAVVIVAREHRPSFLLPGLRLNAYVTTADGAVTVVDLVKLAAIARVPVGPGLSGMREHPTRAEVWGVSSQGGYAWVLSARTDQITARIPVGPLPFNLDFSASGNEVYVTASGANSLMAIDCETHAVVGHGKTGRNPVIAHVTPDGKQILVVNHGDATLGIHDPETLELKATVPVVATRGCDDCAGQFAGLCAQPFGAADFRGGFAAGRAADESGLGGRAFADDSEAGWRRALRAFPRGARIAGDQYVHARGRRLRGDRVGADTRGAVAGRERAICFRYRRGASGAGGHCEPEGHAADSGGTGSDGAGVQPGRESEHVAGGGSGLGESRGAAHPLGCAERDYDDSGGGATGRLGCEAVLEAQSRQIEGPLSPAFMLSVPSVVAAERVSDSSG